MRLKPVGQRAPGLGLAPPCGRPRRGGVDLAVLEPLHTQGPYMKYDDVVLGRRSIRGYKPDPVPRELIEAALDITYDVSRLETDPAIIIGEAISYLRLLDRARVNDAAKADALFTLLMGDEVPPRRQFIEDNALNVQFLDV